MAESESNWSQRGGFQESYVTETEPIGLRALPMPLVLICAAGPVLA